jgi:hypothetical protein
VIAISKLKPSSLGLSEIAHQSRSHMDDRVLECLFFEGNYIEIKNGTERDVQTLDEYFEDLINKFRFSEALQESIRRDYAQNKESSEKLSYLRDFTQQLEGIIETNNPPLHQKIKATRDYETARTGISCITLGWTAPLWSFDSNQYEKNDPIQNLEKSLVIIRSDSLDRDAKIIILGYLESMINTLGIDHYSSEKFSEKELINLSHSAEILLLECLQRTKSDIAKDGQPLNDSTWLVMRDIGTALAGLCTNIPKASENTKAIFKIIQNMVPENVAQAATRAYERKKNQLAAQKSPAAVSTNTMPQAAKPKRTFFDRFSSLGESYDGLQDNGKKVTQPMAAHTEPVPAKKPWVRYDARKQKSSTTYESQRMVSIEQYHKTLDVLASHITTISSELNDRVRVISTPAKDQKSARQFTIQYEDKPEERIIHSFDENKRLLINVHPADGDRPLIYAMREAVAANLSLELQPNAKRDLNTLLKVLHASLLYSEGHVKIHQDDLALLDRELRTKPTSELAQTYRTLLELKENPEQLKARSSGKLGKLLSLPEEDRGNTFRLK